MGGCMRLKILDFRLFQISDWSMPNVDCRWPDVEPVLAVKALAIANLAIRDRQLAVGYGR
jgi:hypothetical protein